MKHQRPSRKYLYAFLTDEEYTGLCTLIREMAFPSTSAYITAVARVTLYGWHTNYHAPQDPIESAAAEWIAYRKSIMQDEERLRQKYFDVLTELAFPVIATRGGQRAFHLLEQEIENAVADHAGIVPSYDQMQYWMQIYETIFERQLAEHRTNLNYEARLEEERCRLQETRTFCDAEETD